MNTSVLLKFKRPALSAKAIIIILALAVLVFSAYLRVYSWLESGVVTLVFLVGPVFVAIAQNETGNQTKKIQQHILHKTLSPFSIQPFFLFTRVAMVVTYPVVWLGLAIGCFYLDFIGSAESLVRSYVEYHLALFIPAISLVLFSALFLLDNKESDTGDAFTAPNGKYREKWFVAILMVCCYSFLFLYGYHLIFGIEILSGLKS